MMQAVHILIERMKTNPEDFFGDADAPHLMRSPKFGDITEKLDDLLAGDDGKVKSKSFHRLWFLSADEQTALLDAYKEARRVRFEAQIIHRLFASPDEQEQETMKYKSQGRYATSLGASMKATAGTVIGAIQGGFTDPRGMFGSAPVKAEGGSVI